LRARVEALLAADAAPLDAGAAATLAGPAPRIVDRSPDARPSIASTDVIAGRYTLQEKLGEGGMGEVWVAKQSSPVKRKVALKLIKTGMDSKAVLARFEQERQALAMMDHPNIARVLDGGMTPSGQPFFVMELVNGLPLTRFCDEARMTLRERLDLFVPICQAVQHAHQKGIVHRDLKPANILVTLIDGRPVPKVIDFGVAKATGGKLTEETMSTNFGAVVGTLEYMAPEQAGYSNVDVDTRADIYSLGVILYQLLTGLVPIDAARLKNAALAEMIRAVQEEEPSKPSTRLSTDQSLPSLAAVRQTEPRKLMAMLRGELDWVVMKCLEKQRDRRYETASALSRDIQRYLADEPVEARPPSASYRIQKFVRRNKSRVIAVGLILLALVGGIIGTTYGLFRAVAGEKLAGERLRQVAQEKKNADGSARKAIAERNDKDKALVRAEGLRLSAQSTTELQTDPGLGLLLAIEVAQIAPGKEANETLFAALDACREERTLFLAPAGGTLSARFTPDGKRIMGCAGDGTVIFWDVQDGKQLVATAGFGPQLPDLQAEAVLSADGKYLVTFYARMAEVRQAGGAIAEYTNRVARLWDAATGKQLAVLRGHKRRIRTAAFSADSKRLVTASYDTTVRVWDIPSGKPLAILEGHGNPPYSACFSRDGHQVLTITSNQVIYEQPPLSARPPPLESDAEDQGVGRRKQHTALCPRNR
jgi:serine/threonine protein kinase